MQRDKPKWRADRGARALETVSEIEASIAALLAASRRLERIIRLYSIWEPFGGEPVTAQAAAHDFPHAL